MFYCLPDGVNLLHVCKPKKTHTEFHFRKGDVDNVHIAIAINFLADLKLFITVAIHNSISTNRPECLAEIQSVVLWYGGSNFNVKVI